MRMSWNSNGIQWIENLGSFWWYFYGKSPWNRHGIWRNFRPKLRRDEMMAFYYEGSPVKNMTWALMEIPSHFTSSRIDGISLVQIHTKFHNHTMSFIHAIFPFHAGTWHGFWTSSGHGISMGFAKKMMGFPGRIWSHFRPNCRQKDMRKSLSHFLQGNK